MFLRTKRSEQNYTQKKQTEKRGLENKLFILHEYKSTENWTTLIFGL